MIRKQEKNDSETRRRGERGALEGTAMVRKILFLLIFLIVSSGVALANGEHPKTLKQEIDPRAFKILKEKSIDPKTGLPKTLDPRLFKSRARQAYQIAREIPEVLAQMPCFCECEAFGHENLLDCFIDQHGAG
jgi:hypothetical protein